MHTHGAQAARACAARRSRGAGLLWTPSAARPVVLLLKCGALCHMSSHHTLHPHVRHAHIAMGHPGLAPFGSAPAQPLFCCASAYTSGFSLVPSCLQVSYICDSMCELCEARAPDCKAFPSSPRVCSHSTLNRLWALRAASYKPRTSTDSVALTATRLQP